MAQRRTADADLSDPARRALLFAAAALPACGAMPPAGAPGSVLPTGPAPAPTVRLGDRWRYRIIDRYSGRWLDEPTWEVVGTEPEVRLSVSLRRATASAAAEERFEAPWSVRSEWLYGDAYAFREPVPLVPSPIVPGRIVATTTSYLDAASARRRSWSQQLRIGGWETVEVPAGRYDCLRVSRTIAFEHPDAGRRLSTRSDTLWYAPAVSRWVQRELRGEYVSAGTSPGTPGDGVPGREDWLLYQLTAYRPSAAAG